MPEAVVARTGKVAIGAVVFATVLTADILTKRWALANLPRDRSVLVLPRWLGDGLPLTLAFNRGAAFSLHVGGASRWFFIVLTFVALAVLGVLYVRTRAGDTLRLFAISLVFSGALGNLIDRLRSARGVVDFIGPVNLGFMRWPIFNVADSALTVGAVLLAISLWAEGRARNPSAEGAPPAGPGRARRKT